MNSFFYLIFALGTLLEILLLWRIQRAHMWSLYPFFCVYLTYATGRGMVLFVVIQLDSGLYRTLYWPTETVAMLLRFLIIWEVFRHTFTGRLTVRRTIAKGLFFMLLVLTFAFFLGVRDLSIFHSAGGIYPEMERKLGYTEVVLLMLILLAARYYQISLGRNVWGLAVGFGAYVSISIANFAAVQLLKDFFPYWRFIEPTSFVAMLGVWTWAFWVWAPNPSFAANTPEESALGLAAWSQAWNRMLATLRKVFEP